MYRATNFNVSLFSSTIPGDLLFFNSLIMLKTSVGEVAFMNKELLLKYSVYNFTKFIPE